MCTFSEREINSRRHQLCSPAPLQIRHPGPTILPNLLLQEALLFCLYHYLFIWHSPSPHHGASGWIPSHLQVLWIVLRLPMGTQRFPSPHKLRAPWQEHTHSLTREAPRVGEATVPSYPPASMSLYNWSMKVSSCSRS